MRMNAAAFPESHAKLEKNIKEMEEKEKAKEDEKEPEE